MEKLSILVVISSFLIPNVLSGITQYGTGTTSSTPPQLSLWTLSVRDRVVSISQNGTLKSEPYQPTLYSIFRSELYINENEPSALPEFSLVGIASGYRICMDRKGFVYTKKVTKKEKQWLNKLPNGLLETSGRTSPSTFTTENEEEEKDDTDDDDDNIETSVDDRDDLDKPEVREDEEDLSPQIPSTECLFKAYGFDPTHSYDYKTAIYQTRPAPRRHNSSSSSSSSSSKTFGNFVAFLKNGELRRYRRPLDHLRMHSSIALMFDPIRKPSTSSMITRSNFYNTNSNNNNNSDKKVQKMLSTTQFKHCGSGKPGRKLFNTKVRECISSATKSLSIHRLNHTNLSKIIQKCLCPADKICRQNQCVATINMNSKQRSRSRNNNRNRNKSNKSRHKSSERNRNKKSNLN